jgi:sulfide:quinone oxidoreductase
MLLMEEAPQGVTRVLVAGAGMAGIEAALALRAFAGPAANVRLIDPGRRFTVPSTATGRAFGIGTGIDHALADVAARAGAHLTNGRLAAVDPARRLVMLAGGRLLSYDALIVAIGARPEASVAGALTFAGHCDVASIRSMLEEITRAAARGATIRLAIVVPQGCAWSLSAYEMALMTQDHVVAAGGAERVEIAVITAEKTPLAVFGRDGSAAVERMLGRVGVAVHTGAVVREWRWGRLELEGGGTLAADRVIALPVQRGPRLDGLPADAQGFVRTAGDGSVPGARDVWAVGDGAAFPVKQGAIACRQADAVAAAIARRIGRRPDEDSTLPMFPQPAQDDEGPLWWPVPKVAGRFLAPFLRDWPVNAARSEWAGMVNPSGARGHAGPAETVGERAS